MVKEALFYKYNYLDLIVSLFLIYYSIQFYFFLANNLKKNRSLFLYVYLYHNAWFLIYMYFQYFFGSDSLSFFINYKYYDYVKFDVGQIFLHNLVSILSNYFNFINLNYLFSILSLLPFYFLIKLINKINFAKNPFRYLCIIFFLFLPSLHFWISGFSKDTICLIIISFALHISLKEKKIEHIIIYVLIFLGLFVTRPHIGLVFIIAIFPQLFFFKIRLFIKYILAIVFFGVIIWSLSKLFPSGFDVKLLLDLIATYSNLDIGNKLNSLSNTNIFVKTILYLTAPNLFYFHEINLFNLILIFENTFLIFLVLILFNKNFLKLKIIKNFHFNILMIILLLIILVLFTSNLGIAARQKWIVVYPMFYLFLTINNKIKKKLFFTDKFKKTIT